VYGVAQLDFTGLEISLCDILLRRLDISVGSSAYAAYQASAASALPTTTQRHEQRLAPSGISSPLFNILPSSIAAVAARTRLHNMRSRLAASNTRVRPRCLTANPTGRRPRALAPAGDDDRPPRRFRLDADRRPVGSSPARSACCSSFGVRGEGVAQVCSAAAAGAGLTPELPLEGCALPMLHWLRRSAISDWAMSLNTFCKLLVVAASKKPPVLPGQFCKSVLLAPSLPSPIV
jgi:hypothetical protein